MALTECDKLNDLYDKVNEISPLKFNTKILNSELAKDQENLSKYVAESIQGLESKIKELILTGIKNEIKSIISSAESELDTIANKY